MPVKKVKKEAAVAPVKKAASRKRATKKATPAAAPKKAAAKKPAFEPEAHRDRIERLAYQLWEDRGRPEGAGIEDWEQAEQLIRAEVQG